MSIIPKLFIGLIQPHPTPENPHLILHFNRKKWTLPSFGTTKDPGVPIASEAKRKILWGIPFHILRCITDTSIRVNLVLTHKRSNKQNQGSTHDFMLWGNCTSKQKCFLIIFYLIFFFTYSLYPPFTALFLATPSYHLSLSLFPFWASGGHLWLHLHPGTSSLCYAKCILSYWGQKRQPRENISHI